MRTSSTSERALALATSVNALSRERAAGATVRRDVAAPDFAGKRAAKAHGFGPAVRHGLTTVSRMGGNAARARGFGPAVRHGLTAFSRAGGSAARARGFTLLEVLMVVVLIAAV